MIEIKCCLNKFKISINMLVYFTQLLQLIFLYYIKIFNFAKRVYWSEIQRANIGATFGAPLQLFFSMCFDIRIVINLKS